jgi:hypothetical protein
MLHLAARAPCRCPPLSSNVRPHSTTPCHPRPSIHMLRASLYGLTILHLGPGIAFALLAFGCDGATPYLGAVCGKSVLSSFALLTAGAWLILSLGLAALLLMRLARSSVPPRTSLRVWALLAVLAVGALLGASGVWLTGSQYWCLAIPASLATGWLFLANPLACQPESQGSGSAGRNSAA